MNDSKLSDVPAQARPSAAGRRAPWLPLLFAAGLAAFAVLPRVHSDRALLWSFLGAAAVLAGWTGTLWMAALRGARELRVEFVAPLRSHYIQAGVQTCVYAYWGWHWREVFASIPLILAQLVFFYGFDALLTWTRGRIWRMGCGAIPIILSTNVFIWFKDDWYYLQFALVATAALGKEFVRWERDGRRTHVFNPSALAMSLFAIGLLVTGSTHDLTWAGRLATTIGNPPHMYLLIFALGLVVQHFFSITLMTFGAVAMLCLLNLLHTWYTGTYYFVFSNLPVPVFLGMHLLVTDPSTSPRTNAGRAVFGALYGALAFVLYGVLEHFAEPTVYDKLLPVPLLNLGVQWIDRWARSGVLGRFSRWEAQFRARSLNLVHMGCWGGLFVLMLSTGYVGGQHEGGTYAFWRKAVEEGRPNAKEGLLEVLKSMARDGSSSAWNELGLAYREGVLVERDARAAARHFAQASKLGNLAGSANLVQLFMETPGASPGRVVSAALDQLESECLANPDGSFAYMIGLAYETGSGRPRDLERARGFYREGCQRSSPPACKALARVEGVLPQRAR